MLLWTLPAWWLVPHADRLLLSSRDGVWSSDGTPEGTRARELDFWPLVSVGSRLIPSWPWVTVHWGSGKR